MGRTQVRKWEKWKIERTQVREMEKKVKGRKIKEKGENPSEEKGKESKGTI